MTVDASTRLNGPYSGDDVTVAFGYTWRIDANTELRVILRSSAGVDTTQTLTVHFSVSGVGDAGGGNVTFLTAPATGEKVIIEGVKPKTQTVNYTETERFPYDSHQAGMDKNTRIDQELQRDIDRAYKAQHGNSAAVPVPVDGAVLGWSGTSLANLVLADLNVDVTLGTGQAAALARSDDWQNIASASTTDLALATSNKVRITGTTQINALGTVASGTRILLRFADVLTLNYNATSLIIPGAVDHITSADEFWEAISLGSGNWLLAQFAIAPFAPNTYVTFTVQSGHKQAWLNQVQEFNSPVQYWTSNDPTVLPATLVTAGAVSPGDILGVKLEWGVFTGGAAKDFEYTVIGGDTATTCTTALIALINADADFIASDLTCGTQDGSPGLTFYINGPWDEMPTLTDLTVSGTMTLTISASALTLDLGPQHILTRAVAGRLPLAGDILATWIAQGSTDNAGTPVLVGAEYVNINVGILDPDAADPLGYYRITTQSGYTQFSEAGINVVLTGGGADIKVDGVSTLPTYGNWTPVIRGDGTAGTPVYALQSGRYDKHGRTVHIWGKITLSSFGGSPTGDAIITGLPFPAADIDAVASIDVYGGITFSGGADQPGMYVAPGTSTLILTQSGDGVGLAVLPVSALAGTAVIWFSIFYRTTA